MGYDSKYGKVTTEHGDIPDDEPVIVFRSRDRHLPAVLAHYRELVTGQDGGEPSPQRHIDLVDGTKARVEDWQREHADLVRTPARGAHREQPRVV